MKSTIKGVGIISTSMLIIAIPMLLVIGFYENWYDFINALLILFFILDVMLVGTVIYMLADDEQRR